MAQRQLRDLLVEGTAIPAAPRSVRPENHTTVQLARQNDVDFHFQYRDIRPMRCMWVHLPIVLAVAACGSESTVVQSPSFPQETASRAIADYKRNVFANYDDVVVAARAMSTSIDAFLAAPNEQSFAAAKSAWIAARVPYGTSEAFRFYDGPIDDPATGREGRINGWPLDEFHIDYTRETPNSGLVNDLSATEISPATIADANERQGERAITTGWHAIEFLLWGQDDAVPGTGPGKRAATDYVETSSSTPAAHVQRRRTYLKSATALLLDDLEFVRTAWDPQRPDGYAAKFGVVASDPSTEPSAEKEAIGKLLRSMGSMARAELSGERMTVAVKNRGQEDEQSCFSDTTATDLLGNGLGIENVWLGRYGAFDGVGVDEVVGSVDPSLAARTAMDIAEAVSHLRTLKQLQDQGTPIDVVIASPDGSEGRTAMLQAIDALKRVAVDVEKAATVLGLSIALESPSEEL